MDHLWYLSVLLLTGVASCEQPACDHPEFNASLDSWNLARTQSGNRYSYVVIRGTIKVESSTEPGCLHLTTITVEDGVVVRRRFHDAHMGENCEAGFVEEIDQVGSLSALGAAPPWTLDQVYQACCEDILSLDSAQARQSFIVDSNGLIKHCSANDASCNGECDPIGLEEFNGAIQIEAIELGTTEQ
jgi:hypothetical protein